MTWRDGLQQEERDALVSGRDRALRDAATSCRDRDAAIAERDRARLQLDAVTAERDDLQRRGPAMRPPCACDCCQPEPEGDAGNPAPALPVLAHGCPASAAGIVPGTRHLLRLAAALADAPGMSAECAGALRAAGTPGEVLLAAHRAVFNAGDDDRVFPLRRAAAALSNLTGQALEAWAALARMGDVWRAAGLGLPADEGVIAGARPEGDGAGPAPSAVDLLPVVDAAPSYAQALASQARKDVPRLISVASSGDAPDVCLYALRAAIRAGATWISVLADEVEHLATEREAITGRAAAAEARERNALSGEAAEHARAEAAETEIDRLLGQETLRARCPRCADGDPDPACTTCSGSGSIGPATAIDEIEWLIQARGAADERTDAAYRALRFIVGDSHGHAFRDLQERLRAAGDPAAAAAVKQVGVACGLRGRSDASRTPRHGTDHVADLEAANVAGFWGLVDMFYELAAPAGRPASEAAPVDLPVAAEARSGYETALATMHELENRLGKIERAQAVLRHLEEQCRGLAAAPAALLRLAGMVDCLKVRPGVEINRWGDDRWSLNNEDGFGQYGSLPEALCDADERGLAQTLESARGVSLPAGGGDEEASSPDEPGMTIIKIPPGLVHVQFEGPSLLAGPLPETDDERAPALAAPPPDDCECWEGCNDREGLPPCEHERIPPEATGPFHNSSDPGPCRCGAQGPPWHHRKGCHYD
jgi:hypothetical protein